MASQDKLTKYYLLCTVRMGQKAHIIDELATGAEIVFTKREINLFLRKVDGHYIAREVVVGGARMGGSTLRQPILVID